MADQARRQRHTGRDDDSVGSDEESAPSIEVAKRDDLDDLLDEIDEVLEHNAEEFVRSYVQKGGE